MLDVGLRKLTVPTEKRDYEQSRFSVGTGEWF